MAKTTADGHVLVEGTIEEIGQQIAAQKGAEPTVEPPAQTEPAEPTEPVGNVEPKPAEPTPTADKWSVLNETLGTAFTGEEDLNAWRSSLTENETRLKALQEQYEAAQNELKAVDPMKFFASQEKYIENQLLIKHPDLDPAVLGKILTSDVSKLDPIAVIAYKELLGDPKHEIFENEAQAYDYVCNKLGYDKDLTFDEQADSVKVAIRAARKDAAGEFDKLRSSVELPKAIDVTADKAAQAAEAQANYDKLKPVVQRDLAEVHKALDKIEIKAKGDDGKDEVLLTYDLGDFKNSKIVKETIEQTLEHIARNAREWTPEIAKKATEAIAADLQKEYIANSVGQILKAAKDKWYKEWNDAKFEKENHHRPLNPDITNPNMSEEQKRLSKIKADFAKEQGLTGKKTYAP